MACFDWSTLLSDCWGHLLTLLKSPSPSNSVNLLPCIVFIFSPFFHFFLPFHLYDQAAVQWIINLSIQYPVLLKQQLITAPQIKVHGPLRERWTDAGLIYKGSGEWTNSPETGYLWWTRRKWSGVCYFLWVRWFIVSYKQCPIPVFWS